MLLKELREKRGISQTFMAKQLGYKTVSGYNNIERGRVKPSLEHARVISIILGETIEGIFFEQNLQEKCKNGW